MIRSSAVFTVSCGLPSSVKFEYTERIFICDLFDNVETQVGKQIGADFGDCLVVMGIPAAAGV